ncbi:hypothetical protein XELAEV_18003232mg [Xenopus laevis]|uniref:Uncharacterized protein n=1 Tax=Xenopus laevis TaxID=8355 RepID=A0A974GY95_XENLA|nr:hypothetical protein XELAEV_18003232mg [Xenopus laevis]
MRIAFLQILGLYIFQESIESKLGDWLGFLMVEKPGKRDKRLKKTPLCTINQSVVPEALQICLHHNKDALAKVVMRNAYINSAVCTYI